MTTTPAPMTIAPPDTAWADRLRAFVAAALARGDLIGSSDPHGEFLTEAMLADPGNHRLAVDGDVLVGFIAPDIKALVVAPERRRAGIGRALVAAGVAIEAARGQAALILGPAPGDEGALAFLRATGFAYHSMVWDLLLRADVSLPPPAWPPDVVARGLDPDADLDAYVALWNAAFVDHPTPIQTTREQAAWGWRQWAVDLPHTLVLAAADGSGRLVGLCQTSLRPAEGGAPAGAVDIIAVAPAEQGRGLGRALLAWGVDHLRAAGVEPVELTVNGANDGALRIYERAGFTRAGARERWGYPTA